MLARMRGLPWLALATIALLALSAAWVIDPIRDAATKGVIAEATLDRSAGYLFIAPISAILDTITLLTVRQTRPSDPFMAKGQTEGWSGQLEKLDQLLAR